MGFKDLTVWDNLHTAAHKSLNLTLGKIVNYIVNRQRTKGLVCNYHP